MNTFGHNFRVSIFGESHGPQIGITIDGVPPGMPLTEAEIRQETDRRKAGATGTTKRQEDDIPHIVSGLYNGHTTGAPLTIVFDNQDARSEDYQRYVDTPRPGHADFAAGERFAGWNDIRGGGQFSGRMTLPVVAAGAVARKILRAVFASASEPIADGRIKARIVELGGSSDKSRWEGLLAKAEQEGDSLGAVVECVAEVPSGMGEPFWNSAESEIAHAIFSIPGVRGIEFGDGFRAAAMRGSEHNDPFGPDGKPVKNGAGGINGGITNGAPVKFRVAFKPTSSISRPQSTLNFKTGKMETLQIRGRHDVCFALRAPAVVEAMTAIAFADLLY